MTGYCCFSYEVTEQKKTYIYVNSDLLAAAKEKGAHVGY